MLKILPYKSRGEDRSLPQSNPTPRRRVVADNGMRSGIISTELRGDWHSLGWCSNSVHINSSSQRMRDLGTIYVLRKIREVENAAYLQTKYMVSCHEI